MVDPSYAGFPLVVSPHVISYREIRPDASWSLWRRFRFWFEGRLLRMGAPISWEPMARREMLTLHVEAMGLVVSPEVAERIREEAGR